MQGSTLPAIGLITVANSVFSTDILAGYDIDGLPLNPDARIDTVIIGNGTSGFLIESNIVAGADAGPDGEFGTSDDFQIGATAGPDGILGTSDDVLAGFPTIFATINRVAVGSIGSGNVSTIYGIVADRVIAVEIDGFVISEAPNSDIVLQQGPNNDPSLSLDDSRAVLREIGASPFQQI